MFKKKISVVIPVYNAEKTIACCLESILQTKYPALEIILVDDASTDNSLKIIEGSRRQYPDLIRLIKNPANYGPAKSRNIGANESSGEYLFFVDSDTWMFPDTLDNFEQRIIEADAVTGIYDHQPLNEGLVPRYKALLNYYFFSRLGVIEYEVFDSSRAGIKAVVFRELGGFNSEIAWGMEYENEEFGYRLSRKYRNLLEPGVKVRHFFPDFKKLTTDYLLRVSLWMEIFLLRRKFESGGVTSLGTGFASAALLFSVLSIPFIIINRYLFFVPAASFLVYLAGYLGFFWFVLKKRPAFLFPALLLNIYFTLIISLGAALGLMRVLTKTSKIKGSFS